MSSGQYSTSLPRTVQHRFRESSNTPLTMLPCPWRLSNPRPTPEFMPTMSNSCTAWVNKRKKYLQETGLRLMTIRIRYMAMPSRPYSLNLAEQASRLSGNA